MKTKDKNQPISYTSIIDWLGFAFYYVIDHYYWLIKVGRPSVLSVRLGW